MNYVEPLKKVSRKRNVPRRPKLAEANTAAILGGITLGLLSGNILTALLGGAIIGGLADQKQPLEFAVREYLKQKGLEVIFYYPAFRSVKVTFQYAQSAYWTIQTAMPDSLQLSDDDREDWLYGTLIAKELPKALREIQKLNHQ
jgi:hypothetical protein